MEKEKLQARKEKLERINRRLKRKKFMAILLALFTLSVNAFAWFVFSKQAGAEVHGNIASWDIELTDQNEQQVNSILVEVNMQPGMTDYSETYTVHNQGDVSANFTYEVESLSILGRTVSLSGISDVSDYLETYYPFSISLSTDKNIILSSDTADFTILVHWDFEDSDEYHALNNVYDFDDGFVYYTLDNNTYTEFSATSENYLTNRNNLYLQRDDADTYFGMKCSAYEEISEESCLALTIVLKVSQAEV